MVAEWCEEAIEALSAMLARRDNVLPIEDAKHENNG
jgi:hypothetical protein